MDGSVRELLPSSWIERHWNIWNFHWSRRCYAISLISVWNYYLLRSQGTVNQTTSCQHTLSQQTFAAQWSGTVMLESNSGTYKLNHECAILLPRWNTGTCVLFLNQRTHVCLLLTRKIFVFTKFTLNLRKPYIKRLSKLFILYHFQMNQYLFTYLKVLPDSFAPNLSLLTTEALFIVLDLPYS